MEVIHIAYALDNNFTELTCVSMASVLYNTQKKCNFHVIENNLSSCNKAILLQLKSKFPHGEWCFHHFDLSVDEKLYCSASFTIEAFYRIYLPVLLPDLDKIIYLDGDTIIERDIRILWETELGKNLAAAVRRNHQSGIEKRKHILGMDKATNYFNSGVMIFNLAELRAFDFTKKACECAENLFAAITTAGFRWLPDQDILNHLLVEHILLLPAKFNMDVGYYSKDIEYNIGNLEEYAELYQNPHIIHFSGEHKPSKITRGLMEHALWKRWYYYKAMTSFANIQEDEARISRYDKLEDAMKSVQGILIYDRQSYILHRQHSIFVELAERLPDMLMGRKPVLWGGLNRAIGSLLVVLTAYDIDVAAIVDSFMGGQGKKVFHYEVQHPEMLNKQNDKYFVLLSMLNMTPALEVAKILDGYNYPNSQYYHVYASAWEYVNTEL
jgi:lipopolysaccharide biosynthesis glycosyltransferase